MELTGPGAVMGGAAGLLLEVAPHPQHTPALVLPPSRELPGRAPGRVSGGAGGLWFPSSSATSKLCDLGRFQPHCLHFLMVKGAQLSWRLAG